METISFGMKMAIVIELYFAFNLQYPAEVDDLLQVLQRLVCKFPRQQEGARNKTGKTKKSFKDFETFIGRSLIEMDQAELRSVAI